MMSCVFVDVCDAMLVFLLKPIFSSLFIILSEKINGHFYVPTKIVNDIFAAIFPSFLVLLPPFDNNQRLHD